MSSSQSSEKFTTAAVAWAWTLGSFTSSIALSSVGTILACSCS